MSIHPTVWKREQKRGFPFNRTLDIGQAAKLCDILRSGDVMQCFQVAKAYGLNGDEAFAFIERHRTPREVA